MAQVNSVKLIDVSTASFPYTIDLTSQVSRYKVYGTKVLSSNCSLQLSGTPKEGMVVMFDYTATITTTKVSDKVYGDHHVFVFGSKIPYSYLNKPLKIWCEYSNSAWQVFAFQTISEVPAIGIEGLPADIVDDSTLAIDTTTGSLKVKTEGVTATQLATDSVEEAKIKAKAVTLAKMADLARGSIIVGNSSGVPAAYSAKTSGQLLIGDGNDIVSVPMAGDTTISAAGVVAIGANKILSAMIKAGEIVAAHLSSVAAIAFTQMAALTASKIPVLNSSGFIEAGTVDATKLSYIDVTTAGVAEASKAVVLSASKEIDELDITTLKYNGTVITATAAQINYLASVTSDIQNQLDVNSGKTVLTTISANTVATAATLRDAYIADTSGGTVDLTLPRANTIAAGKTVRFTRIGGNAATLVPNKADTITTIALATPASLACSGTGKGILAVCDGVSNWQVISYE